ncbi:response regulator [Leptolyngbya sp. FACHB-261]|uniref:response regulator n=1 Tax=Leptolyngbya sp. FACHB-261 TaxID=2692806 RepID=UPI001686BA72|nr:response regulator [Leptolyngbya sp. FACHB-261]MBD2104063.1 response regulator [Leptolyngbya sp. FACHB-261]
MLSQPLRLLLIDDSSDDRALATRELRREFPDLEVTAIAAEAALEQALAEAQFDLVVTDYQLRWGTGQEVLDRVKARYPTCPVVMFTNSGSEEIAVKAMKTGLSNYVLKSNLPRLPVAVQESLEKARLQQQYQDAIVRLQLSEELFRTMADSAPVLLWIADTEGLCYFFNQPWLNFTGRTLEQERGHGWAEGIHPEDKDYCLEVYLKAFNARQEFEMEYRLRRSDGEYRWVLDRGTPRFASDGGFAGYVGSAIDVTERKRVAAERDQLLSREQLARAEAEAAECRAAFLSEASRLFTASLDYESTLASVARLSVAHLADWCIVDLIQDDESLTQVASAHADPDQEKLLHELCQRYPLSQNPNSEVWTALQTGQAVLVPELSEAQLKAQALNDDHLNLLHQLNPRSYMLVPLLSRGQKLGAIGFVSASERRYSPADLSLAEELARRAAMAMDNARAHRQSQVANRIKDEFLATLSHELRAPLNGMLGWAQLLRRGRLDAATTTRALETIERNTKAQSKLIDDLLDVSRIITGKLRLEVRLVQLATIIEAAIDAVRIAAQAKDIEIKAVLDRNLELPAGDPDRLQQVIWNLLSNAVKFTPEGGQIQVGLERVHSRVQISVSDTGQGIRPEFLPYVFDRFRQADSSITRAHGGLGLGLAIVRHLVELHGGTVQAESPGEGQGTTFTVQLPIAAVRNEAAQLEHNKPYEDQLVRESLLTLQGIRVLIVDDEADARELLTIALEQFGATVTATASASEALTVLQQLRPDVLVSDIGMPGEDGYILIRQIRALKAEQGGQTPAVALTAYVREEDRALAIRAGFQVHVSKPVEPVKLAMVVASLTVKPLG